MKKMLVWFHPKGYYHNFISDFVMPLGEKLEADVFAFNAPFAYKSPNDGREGFMWYDKDKNGEIIVSEFEKSVEYAVEKIGEEMERRGISFNDVIFAGNSQGGFMATYLGLVYGADKMIVLCSYVPEEYEFKQDLHKNVPIYWVEAAKEEVLSDVQKETYKILQNMGCNLKYILSEESTHNGLDLSILDEL